MRALKPLCIPEKYLKIASTSQLVSSYIVTPIYKPYSNPLGGKGGVETKWWHVFCFGEVGWEVGDTVDGRNSAKPPEMCKTL